MNDEEKFSAGKRREAIATGLFYVLVIVLILVLLGRI
jgi:hypothetical protein